MENQYLKLVNLTKRFVRPLTVGRDPEYWDESVADLVLRVLPRGRTTWYLRYYAGSSPGKRGKYRRLKIGRYPENSIADARKVATDLCVGRWRSTSRATAPSILA